MFFKKIKSNIVFKNILILFTGTGVAQIIPVVLSVFLARLYGKEDFGELSIFASICGVLGTIAALRYDLIIVMLKNTRDAINIVFLGLTLSLIVGLFSFLLLCLLKSVISENIEFDNYYILMFIGPITISLTGWFNVLNNWFNRESAYRIMAIGQVNQSAFTSFVKLLLGLVGISTGLIWGTSIGYTAVVVYYIYLYLNINYPFRISLSKIKKIAWEYRDFAIYSSLSALFNSMSNIGLPIIISFFYSVEIAGLYFFANNLVRLPINLLSSAISQVYKKEASIMYLSNNSDLVKFTLKIQKMILIFILPILIVLLLYGEHIFAFLFSNEWRESGEMIKYFSVLVLFNSLFSPISSILDIIRKQKVLLLFNISLVATQVIVFSFSGYFRFEIALLISSIIGALHFIWIDLYVKKYISHKE